MTVNLVNMKTGEYGVVVDIEGGHAMAARVRNMGIRMGKKIKKIGTYFGRGPQTVMVDNIKIAIGYGMAQKVLIEVER